MTATLLRTIKPVQESDHKLRATGRYLVEFYARRIKRLIPAAAVTLLATLGLVWLTGNFSTIEATSKQVVASTLFAQNLFLAHKSVDYLAASTPPTAVQHFWSLSLEEQFYLMWPLVLLAVILVTANITILYKKHRIPGAIIPVGLFVVGSFLYGYTLTQTNPSAAYFVTFARVWELLIGGLIVFLPRLRHYDLQLLLPWLGTAMIGYALFKWDGIGFPGWHALVPTIGTAMIIYAGAHAQKSTLSFTHVLRHRAIQWVGNISYSLYLWHWPLIVLVPVLLTVDIEGEYGKYIKLSILAASFILAQLSYRFIEQPSQNIQLSKRWIYILFICTIGLVGGIGYWTAGQAKRQAETQLSNLHSYAMSDKSLCLGGRALSNPKQCGGGFDARNSDFTQINSIDMFTRIIRTDQECTIFHPTPTTTPDPANLCFVGDEQSSRLITLWGDSHASQWINALDIIGKKYHVKFAILSSGQCAGIDVALPYCKDRLDFIRSSNILNNSDAIIVALWYRYDANSPVQPTQQALNTLHSLTKTPVYLLQDIPPAGRSGGPDCDIRGLSCKNDINTALGPMESAYKKAVADGKITQDYIIPTQDMFCDTKYCYSFIGGLPVYQSSEFTTDPAAPEGNAHITATYSLTLADLLATKLRIYRVIP